MAFDPAAYVQPADIADRLDPDSWTIEVDEVRERPEGAPASHHVRDTILRVHRR